MIDELCRNYLRSSHLESEPIFEAIENLAGSNQAAYEAIRVALYAGAELHPSRNYLNLRKTLDNIVWPVSCISSSVKEVLVCGVWTLDRWYGGVRKWCAAHTEYTPLAIDIWLEQVDVMNWAVDLPDQTSAQGKASTFEEAQVLAMATLRKLIEENNA